MKERVYIEETTSEVNTGETTVYEIKYEIKYDNGKGAVATFAECWDKALANELAKKVAEYLLRGSVAYYRKHELGDLEGWYRI